MVSREDIKAQNKEKKLLRRSLLQQRESLSVADWRFKSEQICDYLASLPQFKQAQTILAYFSFRQEPDLSPLFSLKPHWGLPRCVGSSLRWHRWQRCDRVATGAYGISEPDANLPLIDPKTVDLMLVPAVACDAQGYRLGYGGGYYDRMLNDPQWQGIPTIGIIFEFAYLSQVPIAPWDRQLNGVCTESQIIFRH